MWATYLVLFLAWNMAKVIPFGLIFSIIGWFMIVSIVVSIMAVVAVQLINGCGWKGVADSIHTIGLLLLIILFLAVVIISAPLWQFVAIEVNKAYDQKIAK